MTEIVCFGELLLRLTAPERERLLQSRRFDVHIAGAEANVAVAMAQFGHGSRFVSAVPDNALAEGALKELRRYGVTLDHVVRGPGRMGIFYASQGAVRRPTEILYDRAGSVFAESGAGAYDWPSIFKGADWLHVSGVTPAVGPNGAAAAIAAVRAAKSAGVKVSFDGNFRSQLWALWDGDAPAILGELLAHADLAFVNEKDIGLILKRSFSGEDARAAAYAAAFGAFPTLQTIAATTRRQTSVDDMALSGEIVTRTARETSRTYELEGVVDRIGGGDAFAAGVLHALIEGRALGEIVEFGMAASALKHSIIGDFLIATVAEVEAAMNESGLDVKR